MEKAPLGQHARKHRHEEAAVTAEAAESINTRDLAKNLWQPGLQSLGSSAVGLFKKQPVSGLEDFYLELLIHNFSPLKIGYDV